MNGDFKKRIPWYVLIGTVGAIIAALSALGWAPWNAVDKTVAKEQHKEIRSDFKDSLAKQEEAAHEVHRALIERIERGEVRDKEHRDEVKQVLDKLDRRTWQIQRELKR
jgi:DNA-binding ferritin-like protein